MAKNNTTHFFLDETLSRAGDKMWIAWTFPIFTYFSAKTNPETETSVLGHEKTENKFKIPQPRNTNSWNTQQKVVIYCGRIHIAFPELWGGEVSFELFLMGIRVCRL